jgi:hypothetical protein
MQGSINGKEREMKDESDRRIWKRGMESLERWKDLRKRNERLERWKDLKRLV